MAASLSSRAPETLSRRASRCVDQELSLVPSLTISENIVLGRVGSGFVRHPRRDGREARELLGKVGLGELDPDRKVDGLGIGQRQLVEVARALGRDAGILILDEPTATLNDVEIEQVFVAVRRVAAHGCAVMFVSHRLGEVLPALRPRDGHAGRRAGARGRRAGAQRGSPRRSDPGREAAPRDASPAGSARAGDDVRGRGPDDPRAAARG